MFVVFFQAEKILDKVPVLLVVCFVGVSDSFHEDQAPDQTLVLSEQDCERAVFRARIEVLSQT